MAKSAATNGRFYVRPKGRPRSTDRDDVLDYGSVDMGDPLNTGWFRLDKESAAKALEGAGQNRVGYEADRRDYASMMAAGEWEDYAGSAFHCDDHGRLRRGFHRAHAVIKSDSEIVVWVVCGATERTIRVDDVCRPWTTHDHMTQKTGDAKKSIAETVFNAMVIIGLAPPIKNRMKKAVACADFYDENKHIFSGIEEKLAAIPDRTIRKSLRLAAIAVAFFELHKQNPGMFDFVMDALKDITKGPARNFRKLIDKCYLRGGGGPAMKDHYGWAKYAIVKFANGITIGEDASWSGDSDLATMSAHRRRTAGRRDRRDADGRRDDLPGQRRFGFR